MGMARAPAVADVMGGLAEDTGGLVLTAALPVSFLAAAWPVDGETVHLEFTGDGGDGIEIDIPLRELRMPAVEGDGDPIGQAVRAARAEKLAPACLAVRQALSDGLIPGLDGGLSILVQSDVPGDVEFGRSTCLATAVIHALCGALGVSADRFAKARAASRAVAPLTGSGTVRIAIAALSAGGSGSLVQTQFHPTPHCEARDLPAGITVVAARTRLERPTTFDRMIETRVCTEMGHRFITELKKEDGAAGEQLAAPLAAISPTEYVDRFRDRVPTKVTGKTFVAKFGGLRGANGELSPGGIYKIRSRAEHHIYENRRANEFSACLVRARRTGDLNELIKAGELMYASHWSHSQRCGIGGVETDQFVNCVRQRGAAAGLFGAKVTGGGNGGELVVLMRDDERARAALAEAVAHAEELSKRKILVLHGGVPGAEHFQAPALEGAEAAAV